MPTVTEPPNEIIEITPTTSSDSFTINTDSQVSSSLEVSLTIITFSRLNFYVYLLFYILIL